MNTQRMLDTYGDPLGAVHQIVRTIWLQSKLYGLLVQSNGGLDTPPKTRVIDDPAELAHVNPFKPVMTVNVARLIPQLIHERPHEYLGAMLRPCEMRALTEVVRHNSFTLDSLLTICVDCLGTYSADEYHWRVGRGRTSESLDKDTLQFARQGGIAAYRYRSACQMCASPNAQGADLNIGVLGLPVRQHILIEARDETVADQLQLEKITSGEAVDDLVTQRERMLSKMAERHNRTRERVLQGLVDVLPANIDELINHLQSCGTCQECMNACPICTVLFPRRLESGIYVHEDVTQWLMSCAGCGMCEQACPNHLPLNAIFGYIRTQFVDPLGCVTGGDEEN